MLQKQTFKKTPREDVFADKLYLHSKYVAQLGLKWFACLLKRSSETYLKKTKKKDQAEPLF